jgi:hypothetical protein
MSAELSTGYHYNFLNSFRGVCDIARRNNIELPSSFRESIIKMYRAPMMIMDQSGMVSPVNDSSPLNAIKNAGSALDVGDDSVVRWALSGYRDGEPLPDSTALPYSGYYAMRSGWEPDDLFLFFRAGPAGSGHVEQSQLHVVFKAFGETLLFNPSTYMYDSSQWRRYYRNTPSHNTIIVDGKWQNKPKPQLPIDEPTGNPWISTPSVDFVSGVYDNGYQENIYDSSIQYEPWRWAGEPDRSVAHTRRVLFLKPYYALVVDSLDGSGEHTFDAHFHMEAPGAEIDAATQAAFSLRADDVQVGLYPLDLQNLVAEVIQGQKDPMLGWVPSEHRPIPTVRFRKKQQAPATFITFLYPFRGERPEFHYELIDCAQFDGWGRRIVTGKETVEIVIARKFQPQDVSCSSALCGKVQSRLAGLAVRRPTGAATIEITGWELEQYKDDLLELNVSTGTTLVITRDDSEIKVMNAGKEPVRFSLLRPVKRETELGSGETAAWPYVEDRQAP